MASKEHNQIVRMLIQIGKSLGFDSAGRTMGKLYNLASADCVWYYPEKFDSKSKSIFAYFARQDKYDKIPLVAFEVAYSEKEKNLRGSLASLQILGASVSIIVLAGKSMDYESYLKELIKKFALNRVIILDEKKVREWHTKIVNGKFI